MTAISDDENRPHQTAQMHTGQTTSPLAEEGLELMRVFQDIISRPDRDKVLDLARKLAGRK